MKKLNVKDFSHPDRTNENCRRTQRSKSRPRVKMDLMDVPRLNITPPNLNKPELDGDVNLWVFESMSNSFLSILRSWEIDKGLESDVLKKLKKVQEEIESKISFLEGKGHESSNLKRFRSTTSVCSQSSCTSVSDETLNEEKFKKFYTAIWCPFCSTKELDRESFVDHLVENCTADFHKLDRDSNTYPYSAIQILPNDTFRCNVCPNSWASNLKFCFSHSNNDFHLANCIKFSKRKNMTDSLFCSCCKKLLPNTYTQIDCHLRSLSHARMTDNKPDMKSLLGKKVQCTYSRGIFKCLICSPTLSFRDVDDALSHFDETKHQKNKIRMQTTKVHCEPCDAILREIEVLTHFNSSLHRARETVAKTGVCFETCFYCSEVCTDLKGLYTHMKDGCSVIQKMRELRGCRTPDRRNRNLKPVTEKSSGAKSPQIFVKADLDISDLVTFFKTFGRITRVEHQKEGFTKLVFQDQGSVDSIMRVQDSGKLQIDGEAVQVMETLEEEENSPKHEEDDSLENSGTGSMGVEIDELKSLFEKAASHLLQTAEQSDSEESQQILADCTKTVSCNRCNVIGFRGCGLSFLGDAMPIFCHFERAENTSHSDPYSGNVWIKVYASLSTSALWDSITPVDDKYIECRHVKSQRFCRLYFDDVLMSVTELLRKCSKDEKVVRPFCLIFRFWLSIQELKIREHEFVVMSLMAAFLLNTDLVEPSLIPTKKAHTELSAKVLQKIPDLNKLFPIKNARNLTLMELFTRFLGFIKDFDFKEYAICLPLRHPVPKRFFNIKNCELLVVESDLHRNLAAELPKEDFETFRRVVEKTVKHSALDVGGK